MIKITKFFFFFFMKIRSHQQTLHFDRKKILHFLWNTRTEQKKLYFSAFINVDQLIYFRPNELQ